MIVTAGDFWGGSSSVWQEASLAEVQYEGTIYGTMSSL